MAARGEQRVGFFRIRDQGRVNCGQSRLAKEFEGQRRPKRKFVRAIAVSMSECSLDEYNRLREECVALKCSHSLCVLVPNQRSSERPCSVWDLRGVSSVQHLPVVE